MVNPQGLDLVLVNPGGRVQTYQSLGDTLAAAEPPVWAGMLATYVRRQGFTVRLLDANAENLGVDEVVDRIREMAPRLLAIVVYGHHPSASTQVMPAASTLCRALKDNQPHLKVLLVGGHVAALPERTLREEEADFVCGGEGPATLVELLQALSSPRPDFAKVHDLWFFDGPEVCATAAAPLLLDLDDLMPGPAWDLLPMERYRAHNWHCFGYRDRQPYAAFYTSLGCPFRCKFCCIQAPFKRGEAARGYKAGVNSYRRWSPNTVLAQIDQLVKVYGIRHLKLADEIFVLHRQHVQSICDLLSQRGYDLNIWAYARVDTLQDPSLVEKLRRAGVRWLALGIEAANARVRDGVEKGYRQEDIFRTVNALRAADINIIGNFIFGLPDDNLETMQETLQLALDLNCEFANFYCTMAYPGSRLYEEARRQGWPLPAKWSGYSQLAVDTLPLPTRYLSGPEVLRFRDQAFQTYFNAPAYLEMISARFGPETVGEIKEMAAHQIVRQYAEY